MEFEREDIVYDEEERGRMSMADVVDEREEKVELMSEVGEMK